tara:strand:- start:503 stop:757 length:255 start_codon:yes stop_codon:yes gene_type:complete
MDGQYKLEDFGKIVGWNKDGTPFMAYRDNKKTDIPRGSDYHGNGQHYSSKKKEQSFEDTVRQLTKQWGSNNMELGGKIRELCDE